MKTVTKLVALSLVIAHVPQDSLTVKPDEGTISGNVDSYTVDPATIPAGETLPTPVKTSPFTCPIVAGLSDEDSVDQYLTANIATVVGGTEVVIPTATA